MSQATPFVPSVGPRGSERRRRSTAGSLALAPALAAITFAPAAISLALAFALAACGSGDDAAPPVDADVTPAESCVRPGDHGNSLGIGEYCTPGGNQCSAFDLAPLCLADVAQDQWFCTRIGCDANTDCGAGAGCLLEAGGSACVPCRCDPRGLGCPQP
jgi:hypothetical protein